MGLERDVEWLRDEANRLFGRLNQVAHNLQDPKRSDAQKAGDVALMASDLCEALREINRRGLFKALAGDVEKELKGGKVSIDVIRADIETILKFERGLLGAFKLTEGAADDLLTAFQDSKLLREWPHFAEATFMRHVNNAIEEVCSVPRGGTVLWTQQTYKKFKKRYGMWAAWPSRRRTSRRLPPEGQRLCRPRNWSVPSSLSMAPVRLLIAVETAGGDRWLRRRRLWCGS